MRTRNCTLWTAALLLIAAGHVIAQEDRFAKWEKEIAKFEEADKQQPPIPGRTMFVGSSSIRLWDLKTSFFGGDTFVNRGFGGSQIPDATHFVDRIILPHRPGRIVFYSGDNDINAGRTAEQVAADFEEFTKKVWAKMPLTQIVFIAIKPSPSRAKHFETQKEANERIRKLAAANQRLSILDVVPAMLNETGQPREELFQKDKLHLNAEGYKLWSQLLQQHWSERNGPLDETIPGAAALLSAKRVVFLGDSITYSGQYIAYLEFLLTTRFPNQRFDFIDLGLPSETCSGLSEPGHAGGKFPRPDVHERLERVLDKLKPELLVACYGMNCGMYHPLSDDRFAAYRNGIQRLRDSAHAAGAQVIHLTPPVFDPIPLAGRTLPAGRDSYSQPYEGYNEVLDKYSEWLVSQRKNGWTVIDLHRPMNEYLAMRRKSNPKFVLAGDGVHAGTTGHWLMADKLFRSLQPQISSSHTVEISGEESEVKFEAAPPFPFSAIWDPETLKQTQGWDLHPKQTLVTAQSPAPQYEIVEDGLAIETAKAEQLTLTRGGFDLTAVPKLSINVRAAELLKLIQKRQRLLTDAWLNEVGHLRPGMAKGLPVEEAQAQAEDLTKQIVKLAQPVEVKIRFVAK